MQSVHPTITRATSPAQLCARIAALEAENRRLTDRLELLSTWALSLSGFAAELPKDIPPAKQLELLSLWAGSLSNVARRLGAETRG